MLYCLLFGIVLESYGHELIKKRPATELTTIKHELVLLKKERDAIEIDMASINSQFRRIQRTLAEIEHACKTDYQHPKKGSDNDNGIGKTNKGNTSICTDDAMIIGNDLSCNLECDTNMEVEKHQFEVHPTDFPTKTVDTFAKRPAGSTSKDCRTVSQVVATQNLIQTSTLFNPNLILTLSLLRGLMRMSVKI